MHWLKSTLVLICVSFLFVGSIGIDIFKHVCEEDGVKVSYFVKSESNCKDHHVVSHPGTCEQHLDDNCCTTVSEHVQIQLDFSHKLLIQPVLVPVLNVPNVYAVFVPEIQEELIQCATGNDPPPESGRSILLKKQYWLI